MMRGEWYRLRDDLVAEHEPPHPPELMAEKGEILRCCSQRSFNGFAGHLWIERRGHGWPVRESDVEPVPKPTAERKTKR